MFQSKVLVTQGNVKRSTENDPIITQKCLVKSILEYLLNSVILFRLIITIPNPCAPHGNVQEQLNYSTAFHSSAHIKM